MIEDCHDHLIATAPRYPRDVRFLSGSTALLFFLLFLFARRVPPLPGTGGFREQINSMIRSP